MPGISPPHGHVFVFHCEGRGFVQRVGKGVSGRPIRLQHTARQKDDGTCRPLCPKGTEKNVTRLPRLPEEEGGGSLAPVSLSLKRVLWAGVLGSKSLCMENSLKNLVLL